MIDFPDSPNIGDEFTDGNGTIWRWNGQLWNRKITILRDAPHDGKYYGRNNAGWSEVGETLPEGSMTMLQRRIVPYMPATPYNLTAAWTTPTGSTILFTPESDNSLIEYHWCFTMCPITASHDINVPARLHANGVIITDSYTHFNVATFNQTCNEFPHYKQTTSSWGQGVEADMHMEMITINGHTNRLHLDRNNTYTQAVLQVTEWE